MVLLIGTTDGLFRAAQDEPEAAEKALDCGTVRAARRFDATEGVFIASDEGLYRLTDGGTTWSALDVPDDEVHSVLASPDGTHLYAGTSPPHIVRSDDSGKTWSRSDGFANLPDRGDWQWGGRPELGTEGARVIALAGYATVPSRLVAAVESVGVYVSDDTGQTWSKRTTGLHSDVHHLLALDATTYIAATGRGLYRTQDAGRTWIRLDTEAEPFWYDYFIESYYQDGTLYVGATDNSLIRHHDEWTGMIFRSVDEGRTFEVIDHPGDESGFVSAWGTWNNRVFGGTTDGLLLVENDGWEPSGEFSARITALTPA